MKRQQYIRSLKFWSIIFRKIQRKISAFSKIQLLQQAPFPVRYLADLQNHAILCINFDSKTEKDFSIILEEDKQVLKWMRPAQNQFRIYWDRNSKQYTPDFVVETEYLILMIETKAEKEINTEPVRKKAEAAIKYCKYATEYNLENGGKEWKYLLVPHNMLNLTEILIFISVNIK